MKRRLFLCVTLGLGMISTAGTAASAGVVITFSEVGADVVAIGGGTINPTALTLIGPATTPALVHPAFASVWLGPTMDPATIVYEGISGPTSIGTGDPTLASAGSGDFFGVEGIQARLLVPDGYISGNPLAATNTWAGQSFSSLGLTPGTYTWTWGSGATADFLTVQVGPVAVPEPSTLSLAGIAGVVGLAYAARRRVAGAKSSCHGLLGLG